jgi:hypothetical protein
MVRRHVVVLDGRETGVRPSFEGSAVLFLWYSVRAVREWAAQCHEADIDLTAQ